MIPACWHLFVPKPHAQEQVQQKEAKDFAEEGHILNTLLG